MAEHDTVMSKLYVINRHGERESVKFDKILTRIASLAEGLHPLVDPGKVAQGVINGMFAGISTSELDTLAAQVCAYSAASHPDYSKLASRIAADNLRKNTHESFAATIRELYEYKDQMNRNCSLISTDVYEFVQANAKELDAMIKYERDFDFDFFAFKTLERSYLLRINNKVVERPQHLWMRVACGIHCGDLEKVKETYELMSTKIATHATPTLFNSGTARPQMSSCFLLQMEDSIQDIYHVLSECALISKNAGGIGIAIHKIRATGTYIAGTNGRSNGLVPMLRVFNDTARYVDQGGGKRKGSFAVYLSPWHADVFEFLDLRKNHGKEEHRARDLFYALWIEDLFMERVEADADWSLMCPHQCPGLTDVYGDEFNELYTKYEKEGRVVKTVSARSLWFAILQAQIETGNPFLCYSDSANRKNNQKNIGVLYSSNLCTEVLIVTKPDEHGVCTLASLCLSKFVNTATKTFDFDKLLRVTKIITRNLNNVIDRNHYPVPAARKSSMRHRPIGIGVQGLADTFLLLRLDYESPEAAKLNAEIFECIYYGACEASCELAERDGPYETYWGSPASEGKLQFDLWNEEKKLKGRTDFVQLSGKWDWDALKERIKKFGLRNSLLTSPMPTASTSQIMGNCESFEPFTSNIYSRRVLSGEFVIVNPHLLKDLVERGLWNDDMKQKLIAAAGSVQHIPNIPEDLKRLYKTVWEIKCRTLIDLAAGRGPFIDQSQSLNLYMTNPTFSKLTSAHFHAWRAGLKTGCYYLRTRAAVDAIKFTVAPSAVAEAKAQAALTTTTSSAEDKENNNEAVIVCPRRRTGGLNYDPNEVCESCSA